MPNLNIKMVSEKLKLSESVIKRLMLQQAFPDARQGFWTRTAIEKWARSNKGKAVLNANAKISDKIIQLSNKKISKDV